MILARRFGWAAVLLAGLPLGCARAADQPAAAGPVSMLDFIKSTRDRRYTHVPHKVLAFYYTWYGNPETTGRWVHWDQVKPDQHDIASSTHYPAIGPYDSHDPKLLERHVTEAKAAGIDGFISTWWGQRSFEDQAMPLLLDAAAKHEFEVSVYWEKAPGTGDQQIDQAVADLVYLLGQYGGHPAFLKVDGKPVIFVYGRVMDQVPLSSWPAIIERARKQSGSDFLLIADGYSAAFARTFDGLHTYNICGAVQGKTMDQLRAWAKPSFAAAVGLAKDQARVSCLTIIPGYDDTKIRKPGINAERHNGDTYRVLWEEAIAADPDWVLLTTWNEWHEGSEIEPSYENGDLSLKITGQYAPQFKRKPFSTVEVPASPGGVDPDKARQLRELYAGHPIGLLPGLSGDCVMWLLDAGMPLQELSWEDVLDAGKVNAKAYPVLVSAGSEHYVQTVHRTGDVDAGLLRYLREGGLLVSAASMPFPFYYNEAGQPVVSAGRLGFPVAGSGQFGRTDVDPQTVQRGWETPPEGADLFFQLNREVMPGTRQRAPFPVAGDLRWRPCNRGQLPDGDVYLSIAELRDTAGRTYGDGIAYLEHQVSEPRGGKNLYVWMRMADAIGPDTVWFGVFKLAAERAGLVP